MTNQPGTLGPPHTAGLEAVSRQLEQARRNGWPELNHADLTFHRYFVEHLPTGDLYRLHAGELVDTVYLSAAAYFVTERGGVVFLERPPAGSPQTRAELEQRQAEREQRRNAPKPRPRVTRR